MFLRILFWSLGVALLKYNVKLKIDERFLLDSYVDEAYTPMMLSLSVLYVLCEHVSDSRLEVVLETGCLSSVFVAYIHLILIMKLIPMYYL